MTEMQPELIICYLGLKFNTYDNFEPYYFDADSVMDRRIVATTELETSTLEHHHGT